MSKEQSLEKTKNSKKGYMNDKIAQNAVRSGIWE